MRLQFKNQQHNNQSFNFERKPDPEPVLGPRNLTRATEGEGPHQLWRGLNLCSTNLVGCSLGSEKPLWASQSPWIQRLFPALVCCLLFCKQHNRVSPPPPPPPPFRSRLFIPSDKPEDPRGGGIKALDGPVFLAGSSPPFPVQGRSWRARNCRSPLPSPSSPLLATTQPLTSLHTPPKKPKTYGAEN